jgi:ribosome-associated toxin RatA of RatAB toxin-antitoxin module
MVTVDEALVAAPTQRVFEVVRDVERWPERLPHYRWVRMHHRDGAGGGIVEMAAYRPFGVLNWPVWWLSEMDVVPDVPAVRFRHIGGITRGMDVEWRFEAAGDGTRIRLLHVWDGPAWPLIGGVAARVVIGPVFVHGIASRTVEGLSRAAERGA